MISLPLKTVSRRKNRLHPDGLCHNGLFERKRLTRSARQINRACVNEHDNNKTGGDIDRKSTQKRFCVEKKGCLVVEKDGGYIEH